MKKDRNAGAMPVYPGMIPNYGGIVMPGQMIPMPYYQDQSCPMANNSELNSLMTRVNNLEQRVRILENTVQGSSSSNYNSTNYQMMWQFIELFFDTKKSIKTIF